jgi:predicted DNA-binding protein YlxM (UPF0122 family)
MPDMLPSTAEWLWDMYGKVIADKARKELEKRWQHDLNPKHICDFYFISRNILFSQVVYTFSIESQFGWYLDIISNEMFSLEDYPIPYKRGIPLYQRHGCQLEMKEAALYNA